MKNMVLKENLRKKRYELMDKESELAQAIIVGLAQANICFTVGRRSLLEKDDKLQLDGKIQFKYFKDDEGNTVFKIRNKNLKSPYSEKAFSGDFEEASSKDLREFINSNEGRVGGLGSAKSLIYYLEKNPGKSKYDKYQAFAVKDGNKTIAIAYGEEKGEGGFYLENIIVSPEDQLKLAL